MAIRFRTHDVDSISGNDPASDDVSPYSVRWMQLPCWRVACDGLRLPRRLLDQSGTASEIREGTGCGRPACSALVVVSHSLCAWLAAPIWSGPKPSQTPQPRRAPTLRTHAYPLCDSLPEHERGGRVTQAVNFGRVHWFSVSISHMRPLTQKPFSYRPASMLCSRRLFDRVCSLTVA